MITIPAKIDWFRNWNRASLGDWQIPLLHCGVANWQNMPKKFSFPAGLPTSDVSYSICLGLYWGIFKIFYPYEKNLIRCSGIRVQHKTCFCQSSDHDDPIHLETCNKSQAMTDRKADRLCPWSYPHMPNRPRGEVCAAGFCISENANASHW